MNVDQLGPYRIERELGRGGMGIVYEGVNVETGEPAAVKLLSAELAREAGFRDRFEAEIEALRKLRHPNIVRLFGFGEQDGQLYYAMELVDGPSLEQELGRGRQFDWREVTQIAIDTCRALRHAHDRGVIHRDLKPGNLLLSRRGTVKLSDFGIARLFGYSRLTNVGRVLGTAEYMAPEQAGGKPVDPRTDLYSLAAVMYVLLTRRPLFTAQSLPEILDKQRHEQPVPIAELAPDCPIALAQIITQLLEKEPERRVPNALLLARQLEAMRHGLSLRATASDFSISTPSAAIDPPPTVAAGEDPDQGSDSAPPTVAPDGLPEAGVVAAVPEGVAETADAETKSPGRFTPVAEEELDRAATERPRHPLISIQTWLLAAGLVALALAVHYFLQPPSAEALYQRIIAQTAGGDLDALRDAEQDIREFLRRYPEDPRCQVLRQYQTEIDLDRFERRVALCARSRSGAEELAAVERAYLEAVRDAKFDPQRGIAKLQALIDLYGEPSDPTSPTAQCLELARRRLAQLREQVDRLVAEQLGELQTRLGQAEQLEKSDPGRAAAMYRAIIELYDDKPWAADAVRHAREAVETK